MEHVRITSLQVAERAGVSQSAVSRVFTPGASASAKTVAKVSLSGHANRGDELLHLESFKFRGLPDPLKEHLPYEMHRHHSFGVKLSE